MGVDAAASRPVEDAVRPRAATALLGSLTAAAAALTVLALSRLDTGSVDWAAFAVLAAGAALAHGLASKSVRGRSFRPATVFVVAAIVLLPAGPAALVALAGAFPRGRREARQRLFDAADQVVATLLAAGAVRAFGGAGAALTDAAACLVYVVVAGALAAVMTGLAEARPIRATRLLDPAASATALGFAGLGVVTATAWAADPWLLPFALAPLFVVHRALRLPQHVEETALDAKTRLYNAERFSHALGELVGRAARTHAPLAVVMADLDFLREINNSHGHLAGDAVLQGVADVIRASVRAGDVAARFGGEEFAILLPDTGPQQALEVAERIRAAVATRPFRADAIPAPIHATISIGVACYPRDARGADALVHAADLALYRAKAAGRNRVVYAATAVFGSTPRRN